MLSKKSKEKPGFIDQKILCFKSNEIQHVILLNDVFIFLVFKELTFQALERGCKKTQFSNIHKNR